MLFRSLLYRKEDIPYMQSFNLTLYDNRFWKRCHGSPFERMNDCIYGVSSFLIRAAITTFPKSAVRKGELECCDCNGSRKLTLVDATAISDVAFGVPNIGGHAKVFLFLTQQVRSMGRPFSSMTLSNHVP